MSNVISIRKILLENARKGKPITYSSLAKAVGLQPHNPMLKNALYQICEEDGQSKPILTAIVTYTNSDGNETGGGFYEVAKRFGRNTKDKLACLTTEQHAVFGYYKKETSKEVK